MSKSVVYSRDHFFGEMTLLHCVEVNVMNIFKTNSKSRDESKTFQNFTFEVPEFVLYI